MYFLDKFAAVMIILQGFCIVFTFGCFVYWTTSPKHNAVDKQVVKTVIVTATPTIMQTTPTATPAGVLKNSLKK